MLVIIIAFALAFAYVANYVSDYQSGRGSVLLQRLLFADVWFKDNQIEIMIYNYGTVSSKVISVFVDSRICSNVKYWNEEEEYVDIPVTIPIKGHETIYVTFTWISGSAHNLKLLTENGYTVERIYETP